MSLFPVAAQLELSLPLCQLIPHHAYLYLGFSFRKLLLDFDRLLLQTGIFRLLGGIPLFQDLQSLLSFRHCRLNSASFLRQKVSLRGCDVDSGLFLADLCRPRLKLALFGFDLRREDIRFV